MGDFVIWRESQTFGIGSCYNDFNNHFIGSRLRYWNLVDRGVEFRSRVDNYFFHFE